MIKWVKILMVKDVVKVMLVVVIDVLSFGIGLNVILDWLM